MTQTNPFGFDIDDDGLPKYSPDRNNVTTYHMYKLGMTDTLPDPEDTHTPFFRTPSYVREKEEQSRQNGHTLSGFGTPSFNKTSCPDLAGANTGSRYVAGVPPVAKPAQPTSTNTNETRQSGIPPDFWEKTIHTMGQAWLQLNPTATADDIRAAFGTGNTGTVSNTPAYPVPEQTQAQTKMQTTASQPVRPEAFRQADENKPAPVNPDNPNCEPLETAYQPKSNKRGILPEEYHPVTREFTRDINNALTQKFGCKPYGIDHAQISEWEGGNKRHTYVPWKEGSIGNHSGITVGSGVDFGQKDMNTLKRMQLPDDIVSVLKDRLDLRQGAAKTFNHNNPYTFTWEQIDKINRGAMLMHSEEAVRD